MSPRNPSHASSASRQARAESLVKARGAAPTRRPLEALPSASSPKRPLPWALREGRAFGGWTPFCAYWQNLSSWPDGSPMGCARDLLLNLAKNHTDLLDLNHVVANR